MLIPEYQCVIIDNSHEKLIIRLDNKMDNTTKLPDGNGNGTTHYVDNVRFQALMVKRRSLLVSMNPNFDFTFSNIDFELIDDDLSEEVVKQRKQRNDRKKRIALKELIIPRVDEEIGSIILKISENVSYRRNFINYSFREEMIGDGIENCLKYIDNYNSMEYDNPFAYFTQTCFYAFVRRINKEGKQKDAKDAVYDNQVIEHDIHDKYEFQNAIVDELYYSHG